MHHEFHGEITSSTGGLNGYHSYSQGTYATINESNVDERIGICDNSSLDINGDGTIQNSGAENTDQRPAGCTCDSGGCDCDSTDVNVDYDQWGNMQLDFDATGSRWNSN